MSLIEVLQAGIAFTNQDESAQEMLADFTDHRVGMKIGDTELTLVVKDGTVSIEDGIREDCHAAMGLSVTNLCGAIDDSYDLMEIRDKGEILKGDSKDSSIAVHFMATFPFFDAMVRLYQEDDAFRKSVDELKAGC